MSLYRATIQCTFPIGSAGGTNTWHIRTVSDLGPPTDIDSLMELIRKFYDDAKSIVPTSAGWHWDGQLTEVGTPSPTFVAQRPGWSVAGTASNVAGFGPAPAMACVSWKTASATRSGRGRTFLGPLALGSWQADGTLAPGALTAVQTAAGNLVTASDNANAIGAVGIWSEKDHLFRDTIAYSVVDQAAVLRSRR